MSTKSVCSSQYMVTDQHWVTGAQIKHSTLSDRIREPRPEQNGLQFSRERREQKARSEHVAVECSKPERQPLGMNDHQESNDAWSVPVGLTSRLIGGVTVVSPVHTHGPWYWKWHSGRPLQTTSSTHHSCILHLPGLLTTWCIWHQRLLILRP